MLCVAAGIARAAAPLAQVVPHDSLCVTEGTIQAAADSAAAVDGPRMRAYEAAARGEVSPSQASALLMGLANQAHVVEVDELARRVAALEASRAKGPAVRRCDALARDLSKAAFAKPARIKETTPGRSEPFGMTAFDPKLPDGSPKSGRSRARERTLTAPLVDFGSNLAA